MPLPRSSTKSSMSALSNDDLAADEVVHDGGALRHPEAQHAARAGPEADGRATSPS